METEKIVIYIVGYGPSDILKNGFLHPSSVKVFCVGLKKNVLKLLNHELVTFEHEQTIFRYQQFISKLPSILRLDPEANVKSFGTS
jgi:hypothetical protein